MFLVFSDCSFKSKEFSKCDLQQKKNIRARNAVELALSWQFWVEFWLFELVGVLWLDIAVDLVNISHVTLGAVLALDIADTLMNSGAAKSSHGDVMKCVV